jgi:cardiolipin synthase
LDFRSLYFHFENGVYLYKCDAIGDVRKDFDETFPVCREVTENYQTERAATLKIWQCILRLFAPLL